MIGQRVQVCNPICNFAQLRLQVQKHGRLFEVWHTFTLEFGMILF